MSDSRKAWGPSPPEALGGAGRPGRPTAGAGARLAGQGEGSRRVRGLDAARGEPAGSSL